MSSRRSRNVGSIAVVVLALGACTIQHRPQAPESLAMDEHMMHMSAGEMAPPIITPRADAQDDANLPPSANTAASRIANSPRHGEWVKIAWTPGSKDSLMAWIVYPVTSRPHTPVVVVVHEIFGLSTWVRGVADQVAADGFIAIAPDLLSRVRGGPTADELPADSAVKLIRGVSVAERVQGISAAAQYAMSQPSAAKRYGVIGFCWGGTTTWDYTISQGTQGFSGGVAYYGLPYMDDGAPAVDSLKKIQVPIMLLSGSKDARIGAAMPAVDSVMHALNKDYFGKNYEGAIHGFLRAQNDPGPRTDAATQEANFAATKDAWPRTVAFLKKNLRLD
ncbi:MAG TPA: dienelactone hydrolase family protein [Gemmatimonadaceae bacterium]|nr:dienelactone hydrolase family protein [Gemmatimonadaceae bacterium]